MRTFAIALLVLLLACAGEENRQWIDLSDAVVERPVDGVGHYVYALTVPKRVDAGEDLAVQMEWRTVGSVDPNARYTMDVRLSGPAQKMFSLPSGANTVGELHLTNWLSYDFAVPDEFPAGRYALGVRLRDSNRDFVQVPLGYADSLRLDDGFYRLAYVEVLEAGTP